MNKTFESYLQEVLEGNSYACLDDNADLLVRMISYAYQRGQEDATESVSDIYRDQVIAPARARAQEVRYHKMAEEVIGKIPNHQGRDADHLYFANYGKPMLKEMGAEPVEN